MADNIKRFPLWYTSRRVVLKIIWMSTNTIDLLYKHAWYSFTKCGILARHDIKIRLTFDTLCENSHFIVTQRPSYRHLKLIPSNLSNSMNWKTLKLFKKMCFGTRDTDVLNYTPWETNTDIEPSFLHLTYPVKSGLAWLNITHLLKPSESHWEFSL